MAIDDIERLALSGQRFATSGRAHPIFVLPLSVGLRGLDQGPDLAGRQVLPGSKLGIRAPRRRHRRNLRRANPASASTTVTTRRDGEVDGWRSGCRLRFATKKPIRCRLLLFTASPARFHSGWTGVCSPESALVLTSVTLSIKVDADLAQTMRQSQGVWNNITSPGGRGPCRNRNSR